MADSAALPGTPASRAAALSSSQIRSTQSRCSGFIKTERRQVTDSRSLFQGLFEFSKNFTGKSATAKCNPRWAAASKILRESAEAWLTLSARGAKIRMSSSGANAVMKYASVLSFSYSARADRLPSDKLFANSPPFVRGSSSCVAQSATADAPGREHSRLISPRCSSVELQYV